MQQNENPTAKAEAAVRRWIEWAGNGPVPCDQVVADVVEAYASALIPQGSWFPIASLPEGRHVMLYWPHGERGGGGVECATVFRDGDTWSYWTHGGPNAGSDWEPRDDEKPTLWKPIQEPPK
ncbi:MAG TPA: hypothetical protein VH024_17370 [Candidatus Angelobacter sp.]|jgi:hypothetical protein|nr:hypothetical protein [Candidatus Angelobacter sp.]